MSECTPECESWKVNFRLSALDCEVVLACWQRLGMGNQGEGIVCGMLVYIVGLSMWITGVLAWGVGIACWCTYLFNHNRAMAAESLQRVVFDAISALSIE